MSREGGVEVMEISILTVLGILTLHFIADFLLQDDWMAQNKSSNFKALSVHVAVYTLPFALFFNWKFAAFTYATHFIVDMASSRLTTHLWQKGERHWFFVVIGADQLAHYIFLFIAYKEFVA